VDEMKYDKLELLAPAGCFPSMMAAIKNGADAIYFGLAQLNMRARARRSFDENDLAEIASVCRAAGVKTYLALNTLLYQHDLDLCRVLLEGAVKQKVDAVILSDMAAVQMANQLGLEVHLSTQLSISNSESVKFYAPYCSRIVFARELSLPMIESISRCIKEEQIFGHRGNLIEIEAFAHGAMCIAVSGRCGMSLYTSNSSANRGACEQNCRKAYKVTDVETGTELIVDNDLIMSPNDILTIDFIDKMVVAGVRVFKLEGRGRSPEYVAEVVRCYREALDSVQDESYSPELVEAWKTRLSKVYNRGFSTGYYLGKKQGWSDKPGSKATHRKDFVGTISNYFPKVGVIEVDCCAVDLSVGDEYLIVGHTTGAVRGVVEEIRIEREGEMIAVECASKGTRFSLQHPGDARRRDQLYRMTPMEPTEV